jgi:hypothetical protein
MSTPICSVCSHAHEADAKGLCLRHGKRLPKPEPRVKREYRVGKPECACQFCREDAERGQRPMSRGFITQSF